MRAEIVVGVNLASGQEESDLPTFELDNFRVALRKLDELGDRVENHDQEAANSGTRRYSNSIWDFSMLIA